MPVMVQFDFPFNGPFGADLAEEMEGLAESIMSEPGLVWKIWIENPATKEAGGIYSFENRSTAAAYIEMHSERLAAFGIDKINVKLHEVNEPLTRICEGPVFGAEE